MSPMSQTVTDQTEVSCSAHAQSTINRPSALFNPFDIAGGTLYIASHLFLTHFLRWIVSSFARYPQYLTRGLDAKSLKLPVPE